MACSVGAWSIPSQVYFCGEKAAFLSEMGTVLERFQPQDEMEMVFRGVEKPKSNFKMPRLPVVPCNLWWTLGWKPGSMVSIVAL